jgi:ureidoglycolate lyase
MRLVTFGSAFAPRLGLVRGDGVIALDTLGPDLPRDMIGLIRRWDRVRDSLDAAGDGGALPLDGLKLLAPVLRPPKILCIGLNYADHVRETGRALPEHQTWFTKLPTAANGPGGAIVVPQASVMVDYEAELVAVIGKGGRKIMPERAMEHVFGYTCGNDVSVRDWQNRSGQWLLGKSFDTHAVFGPWIVTADEIPDPHSLDISCTVDGAVRQSSNTRELIFRLPEMIAHVSTAVTLEPGDLIYTGTPSGVAMAMTPQAWLTPGQSVSVHIAGIGTLSNPVTAERQAGGSAGIRPRTELPQNN